MKKTKSIIRIGILLMLCVAGAYSIYKTYRFIFVPRAYALCPNATLSQSAQEQIDRFIAQEISYCEESSQSIATKIKEKFPYIKAVTIARLATQTLQISLVPHKPLFIVNTMYALVESGYITSKDSFNKTVIASLPTVTVHELVYNDNNYLTPSCSTCLISLSPHFFEEYHVSWVADWEIWLKDKKQPRFAFLCDIHSLSDEHKIPLCSSLKDKVVARKAFNYNTMKTWVADIRFDNQIVIFSRGGRGHGYTTFT